MALHSIKKTLASLAGGLLYPSESDFPFEILDWGRKSDEEVSSAVIASSGGAQPVETVSCADFFDATIHNLRTGGDEPSKRAALRYQELQSFIAGKASSCYVCRCGKVRVGIFVVMRFKDEHVLVLKTTAIET